jgi:DegV family protein with EDD domain
MINILTDSTADLSREQCERLNIDIIPMYVQVNGKVYRDGEEIDAGRLFETVEKTGKYPTTSAPSPSDFINFFNRKGKSIYLGVSSMLSTTIQNARLALQEIGNHTVEVIDSLSISTAYGQAVLKAAEWRNEGMGFQELTDRIQALVKKSHGILILDHLDYLFHGGRCSAIQHFVSSLLRIRPLLNICPNGTLGVFKKVPGTRKKAVEALLDYFIELLSSQEIHHITLTHLDCDDEVTYLRDEINALGVNIEIATANVGCALATHSGPHPLGIAYYVD